MNIRKIKKAPQRVEVKYVSSLGLKAYGVNNLYPQEIANIVRASSTGAACVDRYARFIEGDGFAYENLADMIVNATGARANDVLAAVADDLALYGGFALHVNYNIFGKITSVAHVPFEHCRLEEGDDTGYVGKVCVHPDWSEKTTRGGKTLKVTAKSIRRYPVFNPIPAVVNAQISAAGGIDNYKGQIMYVGQYGRVVYPTPKADRVLTDLSTDEGLANIKFRNARCNFLTAQIFITKQDQTLNDNGEYMPAPDDGFADTINEFQGDEATGNILQMTVNNVDEMPEIKEFPTKNFDKDFTVTDQSVVERIYCAYEQEPFLAIRNGKLGFSGTVVRDAYKYYSSLVRKEQAKISRAFAGVFENWFEPIAIENFDINPLDFIADE